MATQPLVGLLPTVNGAQVGSPLYEPLGLSRADGLTGGASTGFVRSAVTFELDGLKAGDQVGVDWGSPPGYPPSGTSDTVTAYSVVLKLRRK